MGAPTSAILAEIYIQYLEHNIIASILQKYKIVNYFRYVDDILIIYNTQTTDIHDTLDEFNTINPKLKFTIEKQQDNTINYLDLTILNHNGSLDCSIYRKPTATDTIIHSTSCHPYEHKRAAISYLTNRLNSYKLSEKSKKQEQAIVKTILRNNGYDTNINMNNEPKKPVSNNARNKYAVFTYTDPAIRMITKVFKNTEVKVAFNTKNTLKNRLRSKNATPNKLETSGIYRLNCGECPKVYIGQTGRTFRTRFKEHIREIKYNGENSKFALHIQNTGHKCANIDETLDILHIQRKGKMMNTLENYRIYEACKLQIQLNEALSDTYNPIFETILKNQ
jgi:hypothetical protein